MDLSARWLRSWTKSIVSLFQKGSQTQNIDKAIALSRKALELCPPGHPRRANSLTCLAQHLEERYDLLGVMTDLDEAIVLHRAALELHAPSHPDRFNSLSSLVVDLRDRYSELEVNADLDEAIGLGRETLRLCTPLHGDEVQFLNDLATDLVTRFNLFENIVDLDEAIGLNREALLLCPLDHPDRSNFLGDLADGLADRYLRVGVITDLNEAICLNREALVLCPADHPDRFRSLSFVAVDLATRYNQLGAMTDLNEAISFNRELLELRSKWHPERPESLNDLAVLLTDRYNRLGAMVDLSEAITLDRETLQLRPPGHPDRSESLDHLAADLGDRFRQLGAVTDLNEAIGLNREALELCPQGHPDRCHSLNSLAVTLADRFEELSVLIDLNEAIDLNREALELRPLGHPERSQTLNNLAADLAARCNELGAMTDLNEAVALNREALELRPPGHPDRSQSLNNLATTLADLYEELGALTDLHEAIGLNREALQLRPPGYFDRPQSLNNLATALADLYKELGTIAFLNEAITFDREALELCPLAHPSRSATLNNLAQHLYTRFLQLNDTQDQEEIFGLYTELAETQYMISSNDLTAAAAWIDVAEDLKHPTTLLAYETYFHFLVQHLAILPSLPHHLQIFKEFTFSLAADAFSACIRNRSSIRAVELLEQGRAVFWSQLTRLRSPVGDVVASGPAGKTLGEEFAQLALLIRNALKSPGVASGQHDRVIRLNIEMQRVVTAIRKLPGFSRFLLPSPFPELKQAAVAGPVVIVNASKYGCDALVVLVDRDPVHVPLSITQEQVEDLSAELNMWTVHAKGMSVTKELGRILRVLWDEVVSPIVDALLTIHPPHSRIWWCPTAEFSLLPLHAAGPYRKGQQNLADLYISSYTPTLTALICARRHSLSESIAGEKRFLTVGQAKATGERELVSVSTELANISQQVRGHAILTCIEGEESCISRVAEELEKHNWVHFACHGLPNPKEPFESAFALHDGNFTIQHIIRCELENPEFAYLSACHTTVGDDESPDETIHLASAMQFVGFRSVVGTMWAVDDSCTDAITSTFYDNMIGESGHLDYTRAAFALDKTMKTVDIPFDQRIVYIHLGA